jgi:hypothetical protein
MRVLITYVLHCAGRPDGSIRSQTTDTVTWAVGRQRQWAPEAQLDAVEPMMNAVDPAQSPPRALLKAGLALKSLSQRQTTTTAATAYAEPAVGMLSTAAGEQCQRNPRVSFGLVLPSLTRTAR